MYEIGPVRDRVYCVRCSSEDDLPPEWDVARHVV